MTDDTDSEQEVSIGEQTARLEEIITTLEDGEVSLERAQQLHEEGQTILARLEDDLEVGDGTVKVEE
ncbi:exodeoxyribonuclease VII small subunit [Natronosalvus vescus]|uniref:exodeoxyribonuclease VII small subunit n=1 Tax=Natronosalvus vescus TaxID=2953881 RepID=UPI00209057C0|nr:exodeoxyribonuclease VII small subunit [Natronosalvus vescus]